MAERARSRWAALVAVLASALVIGGVGAYSWAQTEAGQTATGQAAPASRRQRRRARRLRQAG
jgi:hypothetical protein